MTYGMTSWDILALMASDFSSIDDVFCMIRRECSPHVAFFFFFLRSVVGSGQFLKMKQTGMLFWNTSTEKIITVLDFYVYSWLAKRHNTCFGSFSR